MCAACSLSVADAIAALQANLQPQIIEVDNEKHIVFFAKRTIYDSEELSFDYQLSLDGDAIACFCGAPNCLGRMA